MAEEKNGKKKIIIDEDWKEQARKEKEKLAEETKKEKQKQQSRQLPPADFSALVSMLATQTLFALGLIKTEESEQPEPDLNLAKYNIDMIDMLGEKTKNNLTDQEKAMLDSTLHQLRMSYVKVSG